MGKLDFSWISTPLPPVTVASPAAKHEDDSEMMDVRTEGGGSRANVAGGDQEERRDVDYDVADGDDDWVS